MYKHLLLFFIISQMRKHTRFDILKKFAANIRKRRADLNITQLDLAERVDCNLNTIGNIERVAADPSLSMVYKIANALDIDAKDLIP